MKIGMGKSFLLGNEAHSLMVDKQWLHVDGRTFLVEQVPYSEAEAYFQTLPKSPRAATSKPNKAKHAASLQELVRKVKRTAQLSHSDRGKGRKVQATPTTVKAFGERAEKTGGGGPMRLAAGPKTTEGFVLDYSILSSQSGFIFKCDTTYFVTNTVSLSGTTIFEGGSVIKFSTNTSAGIALGNCECRVSAYRPVVFTSMHDDSVGDGIAGSSGNPWTNYCGAIGLDFSGNNTQNSDLKYFRLSHLNEAIKTSRFGVMNNSDLQLVHCAKGISGLQDSTLILRNALLYKMGDAIKKIGEVTMENVTLHICSNFHTDPSDCNLHLTNSLLVLATNVASCATITSNNTAVLTSDTGVFQTIGAGAHYLANGSPYRNAGTTSINTSLLASLQKKTTYPPILITNNPISSDLTLFPQAQRDTDVPDVGYHYDPLDYCIGNNRVNGAILNATNGTALAFFQTNGAFATLILECGAYLWSSGTADNLSRMVWYNTVQEQSSTNWAYTDINDMISCDNYGCSGVSINGRFCELSKLAGYGVFIGYGDVGIIGGASFRDSLLRVGGLLIQAVDPITSVESANLELNNCLLERCPLSITGNNDETLIAKNCLFYGGGVSLDNFDPAHYIISYILKDNFFYTNSIFQGTGFSVTHDHNAYITNCDRLSPNGTGDIILTNFTFLTGTLGTYYYQTNVSQINAGSQNATNAGLYHYTTFTNNVKEATSVVDVGFHYVATDSSGIPLDTDSDSIPDYIEDANGNGTVNSRETDWQDASDLGLRVWITRPRPGGNLP